jgi:hypothetical protein
MRLTFAASALLAVIASSAIGATSPPKPSVAGHAIRLPFIEDDFARAVAEAKARKVPLFVEAWAPW